MSDPKENKVSKRDSIKVSPDVTRRIWRLQDNEKYATGKRPTAERIIDRALDALENQSSRPSGGSTYKLEPLVTEQEASRYSTSLPGGLRDLLGEMFRVTIAGLESSLLSLRHLAQVVSELENDSESADTADTQSEDAMQRYLEEVLREARAFRARTDKLLGTTAESEPRDRAS